MACRRSRRIDLVRSVPAEAGRAGRSSFWLPAHYSICVGVQRAVAAAEGVDANIRNVARIGSSAKIGGETVRRTPSHHDYEVGAG
jgi:hypothetical protein